MLQILLPCSPGQILIGVGTVVKLNFSVARDARGECVGTTEEKHKECESEKIGGRLYERPDIASDKVVEKISYHREMSGCYGEERGEKREKK